MTIQIRCPNCNATIHAASEHAGKSRTCWSCGSQVSVPIPDANAPPPQLSANLQDCPDCGQQISRRASACPHCGCPIGAVRQGDVPGRRREANSGITAGILIAIVGLLVLFASVWMFNTASTTQQRTLYQAGGIVLLGLGLGLGWLGIIKALRSARGND